MEDKNLYREFEKFLEKEHSQENLWFYKDTTQFSRKNWDRQETAMRAEARKICDKYLGTGGEEKLLSSSDQLIAETVNSLDTCNQHVFDLLTREIEAILKTKYMSFQEA